MNSPFGFPPLDPSKMDPKVLMQLSQLIQQLPPDQLSRMQTLMHNAMGGFDVSHEMAEFERALPPGFREKLMSLMAGQMGTMGAAMSSPEPAAPVSRSSDMDLHEARMTILRAVADGRMTPEVAEPLLFKA